jgi:hypothetical protein
MKNSKNVIILGGLLMVAALTACGSKTQTIHIQLVPSNDPATLLTRRCRLRLHGHPLWFGFRPGRQ